MSLTRWALKQVLGERSRQDKQWGEQNHPYWSPQEQESFGFTTREQASLKAGTGKQINAARVEAGTLAWDGILLEEVFEALAEEDNTRRIEELTQVAAVAVAMIEAIRRGGTR